MAGIHRQMTKSNSSSISELPIKVIFEHLKEKADQRQKLKAASQQKHVVFKN